MNCLPVIEMEMRSASRRKWTFTLRLIFAAAGAGACLVMLAMPRLASAERGRAMLTLLSYLSLAFCATVGGFLTADCISSEKRDGTLGLLFLTPLKGMDIVFGKMVCHGTQMFYGLLAIFPVFFIPILSGGVTWSEVSRIVLALGLALILAASIGMFVSVFATESRAAIMATLCGILIMSALPMVSLMVCRTFLGVTGPLWGLPQFSPVFTVFSGFESRYVRAGGPASFWISVFALAGMSLVFVLASGFLLGRRITATDSASSSRQCGKALFSNVGVLERNPYEWTMLRNAREARSFGLLTIVLILFFVVMMVASLVTSHWQEGFIAAFFTALAIHLIAKLRFAVEATRQINSDHQSGALELLLVTTLSKEDILEGHQRALRGIARKQVLLLICLNFALESWVLLFPTALHMDSSATVMFTSFFVGGMFLAAADFFALRWLGLLHGLRASTHVKAALGAFSSTMLLPWIGLGILIAVVTGLQPKAHEFAVILSIWVGCGLLYDWLLVRSTSMRLGSDLRRLASEGI